MAISGQVFPTRVGMVRPQHAEAETLQDVFPTRVGMIRRRILPCAWLLVFPTRVGVDRTLIVDASVASVSPRVWG